MHADNEQKSRIRQPFVCGSEKEIIVAKGERDKLREILKETRSIN